MKPSERIEEIQIELTKKWIKRWHISKILQTALLNPSQISDKAILMYLDEQSQNSKREE